MKLAEFYKAIIFDFDGVIVESTDIKTQAFHELFKKHPCVKEIVAYHQRHSGVSRFIKIRHIYRHFIKEPLTSAQLRNLSRQFSSLVVKKVVRCPYVPGALAFLQKARPHSKLFIISATPQNELLSITKQRHLKRYFNGIYGAPSSKPVMIRRILRRWALKPSDVLYVGDARADWDAARATRVHFVGRVHGKMNPFPRSVHQIANLQRLCQTKERI